MANYTEQLIDNQKYKIFLEQNITDNSEIMNFNEEDISTYGAFWLTKYRDDNQEFYSLKSDLLGEEGFTGLTKIKKLDHDFYKLKTSAARQNMIYTLIEQDQKTRETDLIGKTLKERTPEQIAAWNAQGGAPALLDAYWEGLNDKQRAELIQYVRYYNEANYNTDVFFDHDTGAIDDLESHNIEFIEEEKFEALGLTDEVKREYQTLWTMLNDSSVDQPYRLANISKLELETHFNKLQNLLNNEQDQIEVSSKNIEKISINGLQEELLDIETRAENLNLKLTDAQREQIQALPPEGRRYILDSLENGTPSSQVATHSHEQNQVETDLDMEIF